MSRLKKLGVALLCVAAFASFTWFLWQVLDFIHKMGYWAGYLECAT